MLITGSLPGRRGRGGELRQVYSHCVFAHARYLLLGWVEVIRSGLKKHSDFLTLGNVDWQLNEGLQAQKITGNFGNPINWPVKILHTVKSSLSCTMNAVPLLLKCESDSFLLLRIIHLLDRAPVQTHVPSGFSCRYNVHTDLSHTLPTEPLKGGSDTDNHLNSLMPRTGRQNNCHQHPRVDSLSPALFLRWQVKLDAIHHASSSGLYL